MSEQNQDLFGFKDIDIDSVVEAVDGENRGPETLRQLYTLFNDELNDSQRSVALIDKMCQHFGGLFIYMPKGRTLRAELKALSLWSEFTGDNIETLAHKYDISVVHAYRIVKAMRRREIEKNQPSLF